MSQENGRPVLGFVGLGNMGNRMAARLLDAGYRLVVFDRTPARMEPLRARGAEGEGSARGLAARCDVVLASLTDDAAVEAVTFGPEGLLAGAPRGAALVDLSTVAPSTSRRAAEAAATIGVSHLDATVSGSTPQAEQGTLVVLVGGPTEAFERCRPILGVLGNEVLHLGPSGAGATMKLVVNALLGVGLQALAEALALGLKAGFPRERLLDVLERLTVLSPAQKGKLGNARRGEYPVTFPLRLMHKDFELILREAARMSVPMPATAAAQQMCAAENAKGLEEDFSAAIRLMADLAGLAQPGR